MSDYFNLNEVSGEVSQEVEKTKKRFSGLTNITRNKYFNRKVIIPSLIMLAIPLTVGLALVSQDNRSSAAPSTVISFSPTNVNTEVGMTTNADIYVNPGKNYVNFVKLSIKYNPQLLVPLQNGFTLDSSSPLKIVEGPNVQNGTITVALGIGTDPTKAIKTSTRIGTVALRALNSSSSPTTVSFDSANTQANSVSSSDSANENVVSSLVFLNMNIKQGSLMPTPTRAPGSNAPTVTSAPTPTRRPLVSPTKTPYPTVTPTRNPLVSATPTPPTGVKSSTFTPSADAFVRSSNPNTNFGGSSVVYTDADPTEISYFKFNLTSLAGKTITKATLVYTVSQATNAIQTLKLSSSNSWSESGLKYSNRPTGLSSITTFTPKPANGKIQLNVQSAVSKNKGGNVTFAITSGANSKTSFYTREASSSKRPQLIVEYK